VESDRQIDQQGDKSKGQANQARALTLRSVVPKAHRGAGSVFIEGGSIFRYFRRRRKLTKSATALIYP
jgi:hypothetical protein